MDDALLVVLCTVPDADVAATLGRGLVEARLAACVNVIGGMRSFYTWKGQLEDQAEVQLLIKTRRSQFDAVEQWLTEHHPYDVPEVLAMPIERASKPYLAWVLGQTRRPSELPP
ncbi:MAG: divalent-cation tolerance protein CutA [Sandaracinaceae bacterium]|nr:divalent-cation tolerance protein CutA [Sandaracinaceae bacterium]